MFEFEKGMICIMEMGIGRKVPGADKTEILEQGTPVKIVEIVEPECSSMVNGVCQAPCKGACCPRAIIVEDCNGKQWTLKADIEDGDFPLIALDEGDTEMLLAKKDWKWFKLAEWTDEGILSKYRGPFNLAVGVAGMHVSKNLSDPWRMVAYIGFGLIAIHALVFFTAGNEYRKRPLPYGQILFYRDYEKNKVALEALLQMN